MLESLIRSKTTRKILALLFSNPEDRFYMRQLERMTGEPVSAVRRDLKRLESAGLLLSQEEAMVKYFWVNKRNPIYEEIKKIIFKTVAVGDAIKGFIKKMKGVKVAFIYGSVTRGEENSKSDIDLMIIGKVDSIRLHSKISEIEDKINRTINYILIKEEDLNAKRTAFLNRVLKEKKIFLMGDERDLQGFN
ncbi:MAG: nucleotidyltransferase domain-containing protein [Candidatus Omnitrophota bacterium]|nr:nucleotidyltransferase domain-containing protein [Candidatus Omnitrophota bacterium]